MTDNASNATQIVSFRLNEEEYALTTLQVREIITTAPPTRIPKAATHIAGLINLRGEMIPVVNLKARFEMSRAHEKFAPDAEVQIIIVDGHQSTFGIMVDSVSQVLTLTDEQIDPPSQQLKERAPFVRGLGKVGTHLVALIDPDAIFASAAAGAQSP